jgi:hypothetical protein
MHQVVVFAPWEIRRTDLDSERVRTVLAPGASYWGIRQTRSPNSSNEITGVIMPGIVRGSLD